MCVGGMCCVFRWTSRVRGPAQRLPEFMKENFGGLKKFLEMRPDIFVVRVRAPAVAGTRKLVYNAVQ